MFFRHLSLMSSEDDFINARLRSFVDEDHIHHYMRQTHSVNHQDEYIPYSREKYQREGDMSRKLNVERLRRNFGDINSGYSQRDSEDDIEYSNYQRSRIDRNLSPSRSTKEDHLDMFDYNCQINRFYHPANDVYQACQVIINYRTYSSSSSKNDQILIKQKSNKDDQRIVVYKGYLKKDEIFSFKSQHLKEYPFDVKFYVNGHIEGHLLTCCEYKYRQGGFHIDQFFLIERIEKSIPCQKCRRRQQDQTKEIQDDLTYTKRVLSDHQSFKNGQKKKSKEKARTNDDQQKGRKNRNNDIQSNTSIDQNVNEDGQIEKRKLQEGNDINETNDSSKSENEEHFQNEFRRMLTEQQPTDTNHSGNILQSFLSLLQNGLPQREIREPLPLRHQGNVENVVVILLGVSDQSNLIHSIGNFVKRFDQIELFNSFVITLNLEYIILITNHFLFNSISDLSKFDSIYLLSNNPISIIKDSNIRGDFSNLKLIYQQMKKDLSNEKDLISFESVSSNETKNQSFSYSQLLKETILTKDNEANLKKDFIDYSRFHYNQNHEELDLIDQFEKNFTLDKSIWWFTRNSFIRKMVNRALRTREIDILFKMRYIIQSINQQIKENHFRNIVYRICQLSSKDLSKLKEHINGLISFGTFLDCLFVKPSSIEYIYQMENILFQIETTNGIETSQLRYQDSKIEVLLPIDNLYYIQSIEQNLDKHYWIIHLTNLDKDNQQFQQLTNEMREDIEGPVILIQLGKLLISNQNYISADYLARLLFNDNSLKGNPTLLASLAALHHLLGSRDNKEKNYKSARLQFEQSLNIFLTFIPEDNQILSATYNNIGSMFYQEDQHDQAIIYHQKALQCQLKSSSPDIDAIATYSGNIGSVYLDQAKYQQALIHYQRSLQILQQSTPGGESLSIAMIYDRIASVYWRMDKPIEALTFYQQALILELKYLPENDHKISVSYFNLSTAYSKLNRLDEAIDSAEKSLQQLLKSVPTDHPEVKENTEQLQGLRRRKWLQQLYQ